MKPLPCGLAAAASVALAGFAVQAAPAVVVRYDGPNGSGQASGGAFNHWDLGYGGSGATTTDGAPRSFTADLSSLAPTDALAVTFHRGDRWGFVSEVQFVAAAVPEPSSWALMLAGAAVPAVRALPRRG